MYILREIVLLNWVMNKGDAFVFYAYYSFLKGIFSRTKKEGNKK